MTRHLVTIRFILAALCFAVFAQVGRGADLTLQQIVALPAPTGFECFDAPRINEQGEGTLGRLLVFVTTPSRARANGVCTDSSEGERLVIYERVGELYRELKATGSGDGILYAKVFVHHVSSVNMPLEALIGIETSLYGTGNFHDYELYRFTRAGALELVPITSPEKLLSTHLAKGQGMLMPVYSFENDRVTFSTAITNGNESNRWPSGGAAFGDMKLVPAAQGLELVPDPDSLQLPSESSRLNQLGLAAYRAEKYDEALDYYRRALQWHRGNYEAASNLGVLYLRRKEWNAAVEVSARVVDAKDASPAIRASAAYNAGRAFEALGDRKRAATSYRKAIELQDSPERRAALARICPQGTDCT